MQVSQNYTKIPLLIAFITILPLISMGQTSSINQSENVHFGLGFGGIVTTTFPAKSNYTFKGVKTSIGFTGGGFFQYDFGRKKNWFFHGELNASFRKLNATSERAEPSDTHYISFKKQLVNISVPLGIGRRFSIGDDELFSMSVALFAVLDLPCYPRVADITIGTYDSPQNVNSVLCSGMFDVTFKYDFVSLSLRYGFDALPVINAKGFGANAGADSQKFYTGNFTFQLNFVIF
ncbi:MAG: hypothetical protein LBQ31_02900 [Bacteroidales bacterium]|nr:hypothetical protein [Bacteroidales bacterium]